VSHASVQYHHLCVKSICCIRNTFHLDYLSFVSSKNAFAARISCLIFYLPKVKLFRAIIKIRIDSYVSCIKLDCKSETFSILLILNALTAPKISSSVIILTTICYNEAFSEVAKETKKNLAP